MKAFWSGAISFGLIYIPVKLYTATKERRMDFNMLRKGDLCPIKYVRVCSSTGEEVPYQEIVKGYEIEKGEYVVLKEEDFKKANPKKAQTIEIIEFVDEKEIDSIFFEKPYYLEPDKSAVKVYGLLREALNKTKKVGVAKFVIRNLEHLAIVKPEGNLIILNQIRYSSEIKKPEDLLIPKNIEYSEKEIDMAVQLVEQLSDRFEPEKIKDTYSEELQKIIESKAKGLEIVTSEAPPRPTEVEGLLKKLEESLKYAKAHPGIN